MSSSSDAEKGMVGDTEEKRKVLFVCIGNSCRSQMAEGFAHKYGSDVMAPSSAGTAPASIVQPLTKDVMAERNITLAGQHPKHFSVFALDSFDLVINMSGYKLPFRPSGELREWKVVDPIGQSEQVYITVRDQIEMLVMRLILELRNGLPSERRAVAGHDSSTFRMGRRRN